MSATAVPQLDAGCAAQSEFLFPATDHCSTGEGKESNNHEGLCAAQPWP